MPNDISALKAHLDAGEPLVIGSLIYSDFPDFNGNPPCPYYDKAAPSTAEGGHAMCVVGYDDNANPSGPDDDHRGGFKVVNSWGADWNGTSAGFVFLSYDFVKRHVMEAWQMDDRVPDDPVISSVTPDHGEAGAPVRIRRRQLRDPAPRRRCNPERRQRCRGLLAGFAGGRDLAFPRLHRRDSGLGLGRCPFQRTLFLDSAGALGVSPTRGKAGDAVTLNGSDFGDYGAEGCYVSFGSVEDASITAWSNHEIGCLMPEEAAGQVQVSVTTPGGTTAGMPFSVLPACGAIVPAAGPRGMEVTISGSGFGSARGDSYVMFGSERAVHYNEWSQHRIRCLVPGVDPGRLPVVVHTVGGDSEPIYFEVTQPATTWYLAEGCTQGGMETWVLVQNPGTSPVTVDLTFMTSSGEVPGPRGFTIGAGSRRSFNAGSYVADWDVSTRVQASGNVICERAMYGNGRTWAHDSVGYPEE